MNKDQAKGRVAEVVGKTKEVTGKIVGNENLELEGKLQGALGKADASYGDAKAKLEKSRQHK